MAVSDPRWLQRGDSGEDVLALQQAANVWLLYEATLGIASCGALSRPAPLAEDGRFGPATEQAVVWLQCRFTLPQDGLAGPNTLSALRRYLASQQFGTLTFGDQAAVLPVRYVPSEQANALRQAFGLAPIPVPSQPQPSGPTAPAMRMPPWLPWAVLAAGLLAFWRRKGR